MKRFLVLLLVALLILPATLAEDIDLKKLSFDELRILQTRVSKEIVKRPEWKEVTVPAGLYQVGVDIPAGEWCLKCGKTSYGYVNISYGEGTNESGTKVCFPCEFMGMIYEKSDGTNPDFRNIKLKEGYYIEIEYGSVKFTTPEKVDLGF